jgi:type VI secretion system secreted protein Hcp
MAVDIFIKIDGIEGESKDAKHPKEIDVLAWSWGMSQSGNFHVGGGGGAGKVNAQDLSITKYIDASSNALQLACCSGKHIPKATLVVRKAGATPLEYIKIELTDLLISSVTMGGSGGEDRLTENISINFAKYKYEYVVQKKDGSGEPARPAGWDFEANIKNA